MNKLSLFGILIFSTTIILLFAGIISQAYNLYNFFPGVIFGMFGIMTIGCLMYIRFKKNLKDNPDQDIINYITLMKSVAREDDQDFDFSLGYIDACKKIENYIRSKYE
jgi:xanthine/uracil permease